MFLVVPPPLNIYDYSFVPIPKSKIRTYNTHICHIKQLGTIIKKNTIEENR